MAVTDKYLADRKEIPSESLRNIVHTGNSIPGMQNMDNMDLIIRNMFNSLDIFKKRLRNYQVAFKEKHPNTYQLPE